MIDDKIFTAFTKKLSRQFTESKVLVGSKYHREFLETEGRVKSSFKFIESSDINNDEVCFNPVGEPQLKQTIKVSDIESWTS